MKTIFKKLVAVTLAATMFLSSPAYANAAVSRFPDVTKKMTTASYWSGRQKNETKVLASEKQIKKVNKAIVNEAATNVVDLKKVADTVDGKALNESLLKSAKADTEYFGLNKYDASGNKVTQSYYDRMINNTQSSDTTNHSVSYGIVVNRTTLRVLPTDDPILDDPGDLDFDNIYNTGLRVNEPVVIKSTSADKKYYYAVSESTSGWLPAEDVAICKSRDIWLDAWDHNSSELLVIYGSKVMTEDSYTTPETANRLLTMGTTLEIVDRSDYPDLISNRSSYNNYVVYLPVRNDDGSYYKQAALISQSARVRKGFLPLTEKNIADVAFGMLGDTYGWGGMLSSEDCSGYVRDIYRCFGVNLARNTSWQSASPVKKYVLTGYNDEMKKNIIKNLPVGSTLFFPGHEMLYLGTVKGKIYVISSVSSMMDPKKDGERLRVRSVVVNTLDIKRANGNTWLASLSAATIPFVGSSNTLYKKNYVGKDFSKVMDQTSITKAKASGKKLTVKWTAAGEESAIEGYQLQYTYDEDFANASKITVKNKTKASYTIGKLKKGSTLKVRMRNYITIDKKKYFSSWSKVKNVKIQ